MIIIFHVVQYLLPERLLITEPSDCINMLFVGRSMLSFCCGLLVFNFLFCLQSSSPCWPSMLIVISSEMSYCGIQVAEDPIFARDGADVYVESNITFTQAIMGGKVVVPTLSGKVEVKIPKGVQHGQLMKLRGKGLPRHGFLVDHGDQYVRFRINFPTLVNERQRAILEEFAKEEINHENSASSEGHWLYQQLSTA
ncbi:hypothetical protein RHMOL_Rhmol07G0266400 [Rhododendron molle]|uniref:Uncharacterized protein n=1 Tax=Rhododendron molle TaxID=49168 RepID=A0ACC0N683_RHOML|nr:hypothetical protein RHMOL_Rhmol07G0266400 [Rhododendron molle]